MSVLQCRLDKRIQRRDRRRAVALRQTAALLVTVDIDGTAAPSMTAQPAAHCPIEPVPPSTSTLPCGLVAGHRHERCSERDQHQVVEQPAEVARRAARSRNGAPARNQPSCPASTQHRPCSTDARHHDPRARDDARDTTSSNAGRRRRRGTCTSFALTGAMRPSRSNLSSRRYRRLHNPGRNPRAGRVPAPRQGSQGSPRKE